MSGRLRPALAVMSARAAQRAATMTGRWGGTSLPGLVAMRIDPDVTATLAADLPHGSVAVAGTNGKTTTAAFLSAALQSTGLSPVHNRAGANLLRGISSTLLSKASVTGRLVVENSAIGLFESDEAALPAIVATTKPKVIVITNLFRDQLDRYGELDGIAQLWRAAFKSLPPDITLVLNADDPLVASLADGAKQKVIYFGMDLSENRLGLVPDSADSLACRQCGHFLTYDRVFVGHMGHYHCDSCGWSRPVPQVSCSAVQLHGFSGSRGEINLEGTAFALSLTVPGFYNVYNALAAVAVIHALGLSVEDAVASLAGVDSAFGRAEKLSIDGHAVWLLLVKNPTGCNEVFALLRDCGQPVDVLAILNDNAADGRDVSWIWDTDVETLAPCLASVAFSGRRALDFALRFKYADIPVVDDAIEERVAPALDNALRNVPDAAPLYVVATYTAMLELRQVLTTRGIVQHYLETGI